LCCFSLRLLAFSFLSSSFLHSKPVNSNSPAHRHAPWQPLPAGPLRLGPRALCEPAPANSNQQSPGGCALTTSSCSAFSRALRSAAAACSRSYEGTFTAHRPQAFWLSQLPLHGAPPPSV